MATVPVLREHLYLAAAARRRRRETADRRKADIETSWEIWLRAMFPGYVERPFAAYHREFWEWVWSVDDGATPPPFVAIWPRGAGKSTSAEVACTMFGARRTRRYVLYVCETQEQADDHVQNVGGLLETPAFAAVYPETSDRLVGKFGNPKGWRRNRLRTTSGFTIDAIGLDTAARGVKLDEDRPDLLIFDDLDGELDTPTTTAKKIKALTRKLIPARASTGTVLAVQNLVLPDGIFSQLADGRADFLADRVVSGPHPAITNLVYEEIDGRWRITGGTPTWPEGMGLGVCQADMDLIGLTAFLAEKQHDVEPPAGGMFNHLTFPHCRWDEIPELIRTTVWVDPAVTDTDQSDAQGIHADGLAPDGTVYRLYSWEDRASPREVLRRAIRKAIELKADTVGVETDQGGDLWESEYHEVAEDLVEEGAIEAHEVPRFDSEKAGAGHGPKTHRAGQMLSAYERGQFVHVTGTHETLERALRRFPRTKPFDLVDASFWSWHDLMSNTVPVVAPVSMEQPNTWDMGG